MHKKSTTLVVADWQWANGRNQSGMAAPRVREYRTRIPIPHPNDFAATFCIYTGTRTRRQDECRVVGWRLRGVQGYRQGQKGWAVAAARCNTLYGPLQYHTNRALATRYRVGTLGRTAALKPCFSVPSWVLARAGPRAMQQRRRLSGPTK